MALRSRHGQRGQALIYGLFVLVGGLASMYFLFNTGQLVREKTKLVNTADAVAYSAGVMHARTLNFEAYTNRAMVANTVAIAQLVSLSSWLRYTDNLANYGFAADQPKFAPFYASYYAATTLGIPLNQNLNGSGGTIERLATGSDTLIRNALMTAQQVAYAGLLPARRQVMSEVADANYLNDGSVSVDLVPLTVNEFSSFVDRYSDNDRTRFAEVAKTAVDRDRFVAKRSWFLPGMWADCVGANPRVDWLDRRGGTELVSFDEWKAIDTLSAKNWTPSNKFDVFCTAVAEAPGGWGGRSAADSPSIDLDPRHYDYSLPVNPGTTGLAMVTSESWRYSGLPNFYDLSTDALGQDDPRLQFAIRLSRAIGETTTSEGRSLIATTPRLNDYHAQPAGGNALVAVGSSEVFFERSGDARDNRFGASQGKPREIGSLFNPYWQVRLIQSDTDVRKAQLLQGTVLP